MKIDVIVLSAIALGFFTVICCATGYCVIRVIGRVAVVRQLFCSCGYPPDGSRPPARCPECGREHYAASTGESPPPQRLLLVAVSILFLVGSTLFVSAFAGDWSLERLGFTGVPLAIVFLPWIAYYLLIARVLSAHPWCHGLATWTVLSVASCGLWVISEYEGGPFPVLSLLCGGALLIVSSFGVCCARFICLWRSIAGRYPSHVMECHRQVNKSQSWD